MTTKPGLIAVTLALIALPHLRADDNPTLDKYISEKIKAELSKMDKPETGYRDGSHWVHFDDPGKNLTASVQTNLNGDRAMMSGKVQAKLAFNYQVEFTKFVLGRRIVFGREDFGGYADATLVISEASATVGKQLNGAKVTIKELKIENLKMRSDAAKPFEGIIQNWVNGKLDSQKDDLAKKLEAAINTVKP
jgi:hypothetical protein